MMLNGFFRSWTMERAKLPMTARLSAWTSFAEVELVEFAEAVADLLEQGESQRRASAR